MIIKKIISGGQTGADRAALDIAIEMGIDHGGWVPRGRRAEDGVLDEKYLLMETETSDYRERTEKNILEADGTLIFSHGELTSGSALTLRLAQKHGRSHLHLDLSQMPGLEASLKAAAWVVRNDVMVLNVAGPRASHDPEIYEAVREILESTVYISNLEENLVVKVNLSSKPTFLPRDVSEAVEYLQSNLSLKDRVVIANMTAVELDSLIPTLGRYIQKNFGLFTGNRELVKSCMKINGIGEMREDVVPTVIIRHLWEGLRKTHRLRVVD